MEKCLKCGRELTDNDLIYWKCTKCGKVFTASLLKLKNLQRQKKLHPGQALLKCPGCGYGIDDGKERMIYKCAGCGSTTGGNLDNFVPVDDFGTNSIAEVTINNVVPNNVVSNNLISCPDCGKQISINADSCPNCGCRIRKKKKYLKKKLLIAFSLLMILFVFCGISFYVINQKNKHQEKINNIVAKIDIFSKKELPTPKEYNEIINICNELTEKERKEISNFRNVEKYKNIDLKEVNDLSERIKNVDNNTSFSELKKIENEYSQFNDSERNLLDISNVINYKKIIETEKKAVKYLNNTVPICKDVMYTIYESWHFQVTFDLYSYEMDGTILDEYTDEVDIPKNEVCRIIKILYGKDVDELVALAFLTNLELNISMVISYFTDNETFINIENNLKNAKKYIKMLDDKSGKKKKLQKYYNSVNKYYKFIINPKCSFDQLADIQVELNKEVEDCKNDLSWN